MPLYEYRCNQCGCQFERVQKVSEPPVRRCERCGGPVIKLISPSGIMFKGTGWYVTDYSNKLKEKKTETPAPSSNKPSDK